MARKKKNDLTEFAVEAGKQGMSYAQAQMQESRELCSRWKGVPANYHYAGGKGNDEHD